MAVAFTEAMAEDDEQQGGDRSKNHRRSLYYNYPSSVKLKPGQSPGSSMQSPVTSVRGSPTRSTRVGSMGERASERASPFPSITFSLNYIYTLPCKNSLESLEYPVIVIYVPSRCYLPSLIIYTLSL